MKYLRKQAEAAQSAKLHRLGAMGSLKAARKAEHAPRKYASGGAVMDDAGPVEGMAAKGRLDRPGRSKMSKKGGKDAAKKGTTVNVVIASGGPKPPMPMAGPPPDMPMPPPGPGGPSMPMRKHGGRVKRADGGWAGEGDSGKKLREDAKDVRDEPNLTKGALGAAAGAGAAPLIDRAVANRSNALQTVLRRGRYPAAGVAAVLGAPLAGWAYAGKKAYDAATADSRAKKLEKEADEAEGKKRGGFVKRGKC